MNAIVPQNLKMPSHLANRINQPSSLGSALSGGIADGVSIPRISLKGSRFRIIEGGSETVLPNHSLDVIIVGANPGISKLWYAGQWTPDSEPGAPDCYSLNGTKPEPDSKQMQNDNCATCQWNQWGSKVTPMGQKIKACADQKRLAVVAANDPTGPIYLLQVTPAALKNLNQYHKELSVRGIPAEVVVTRLTFDSNASFPKLMFSFANFIDEGTQTAVDALFGSSDVHDVTGENSVASVKIIEAERPRLVKPAAPPIEVEAEVVEPAKPVRGFAQQAAPAPTKAAPKRVTQEPPKATVTTSEALHDSIASLMNDMSDDDSGE